MVLELGAGVWPFTLTDPAHDRSHAVKCQGSEVAQGTPERHVCSGRQLQATSSVLRGRRVLTGDQEQCQNE